MKIPRSIPKWILAVLLAAIASSCSQEQYAAAPAPMQPVSEEADLQIAAKNDRADVGQAPGAVRDQIADPSPVADERKKIMTGQVEVQVQDLAASESALAAKVQKYGGYLSSGVLNIYSYEAQVKIPASSFEAFLSEAGELGKVMSKNVQVEDVTSRYFDLASRIKNKKLLQERYQSYLKAAHAIEDILAVERQLNDVTQEIEGLEGSFAQLSRLITYSTLNFSFRLPPAAQGYFPPSLSDGFADLGRNLVEFLYGAFFFILYTLIFGIPILLVAALVWRILFGKTLGLAKRIQRFFTGQKNPPAAP